MSAKTPPPRTEVVTPEKRIPSTTTSPIAKKQKTMDSVNPTTSTSSVTNPPGLPSFQIKKLSSKARTPTRGSKLAAGYDMYASKDTVVPAKGKVLVETDIAMAVPTGTYGRIAPRSGLAVKSFIDTGAGVIDADYRGQVKILLFNHADTDFEVKEGDRVAQLILERIYTPDIVEVVELEESVRGVAGFGSTGIRN